MNLTAVYVLLGICIILLSLGFHLQGRVERLRDRNRSLRIENNRLAQQSFQLSSRLWSLAGKVHESVLVDSNSQNKMGSFTVYSCPACDKVWVFKSFNYCPECGKALDWSDVVLAKPRDCES